MLNLGQRARSTYDRNLEGEIVGYGAIDWNDATGPKTVYLIKVAQGSSSLGPAVRVLSTDHAINSEIPTDFVQLGRNS